MIKFTYTDDQHEEYGLGIKVEVDTAHEHLDKIVETFKTFLIHLGHHPDNVRRVRYEERQQGFPQQLELPL